MSLDQDPPASSPFDQDPPAVAQPTLPPPPVEPTTATSSEGTIRRRHRTLATASLAAGVAAALGGWVLLEGHDGASAAAAASPPPLARPVDLFARIDRLVDEVPRSSLDDPCPASDGPLPVVLYASEQARRTNAPPGAIESAAFASATRLSELDERLASASRIALVRTIEVVEPRASVGSPTVGRYEGQLVVVDTSNGTALCHGRVVAWSSSQVGQPGVAERTLRDDFVARIRSAFSDSGARLHLELDL
jgi:hypothetical protein